MLRLSKPLLAGVGSVALVLGSAAFAQSGLGMRLDAQEQQLTQDEQSCREVNLAEYARLLEEANQNKQRAEKAKKKGVPVDDAQINSDLGRAMQLFARAQAAQARQCMMRAHGVQIQPQAQSTGGSDTGGAAGHGGQAGNAGGATTGTCPSGPPRTSPASEPDPRARIPNGDEVNTLGEHMEDALKSGHFSEAAYWAQQLDEAAAQLRRTINAARQAGAFSAINVEDAEARLRQIENWRKWASDRHIVPCNPPQQPARSQTGQTSQNLSSFAREVLAAHNAVRAKIGSPDLQWDPVLAEHAEERSQEMERAQQLTHAPREGRGTERENILRAPVGYSTAQMMNLWAGEAKHYRPGLFPDVSDTGDWNDVAHYTQMAWASTLYIGCGSTSDGTFTWLVCRYNPGGNKDGKPVVPPPTADQFRAVAAGSEVHNEPTGSDSAVDLRNTFISFADAYDRLGDRSGGFLILRNGVDDEGNVDSVTFYDPAFANAPTQFDSVADANYFDTGSWRRGVRVGTNRNSDDAAGANALFQDINVVNFGDEDGISGFIGGGVGVARVDYNNVRAFSNMGAVFNDESDRQFVEQLLNRLPHRSGYDGTILTPEEPAGGTTVEPPKLGPTSTTFDHRTADSTPENPPMPCDTGSSCSSQGNAEEVDADRDDPFTSSDDAIFRWQRNETLLKQAAHDLLLAQQDKDQAATFAAIERGNEALDKSKRLLRRLHKPGHEGQMVGDDTIESWDRAVRAYEGYFRAAEPNGATKVDQPKLPPRETFKSPEPKPGDLDPL